ncbi:hypothetical protein GCM10027578_22110 [Spirosoma luteolum]
MKTFTITLLVFLFLVLNNVIAQTAIELNNGKSMSYDEYEYGFDFDHQKDRRFILDSKSYDEYDVTVFVKNRQKRDWVRFVYSNGKNVVCDHLAEFNCYNGISRKGYSTSMILYGKPKHVPYIDKQYFTTYYNETPLVYATNQTREMLVGYTLTSGDVVTVSYKVLVPKGESPKMKVKPYGR